MSVPADYVVVDVPGILAVKATISDEAGVRPDPDWNRQAAESQFVFAEFLAAKGLIADGTIVERRPELIVRWKQLSEVGQQFVKNDYHKWLISIDRSRTTEDKMREKLERRWSKFVASNALITGTS